MDKSEFTARIKEYNHEIKKYGKSSIKTTTDMENLMHACLVDWDELDEISRFENSLTHNNKNYKDLDRANIDMIMDIIQHESQKKLILYGREETGKYTIFYKLKESTFAIIWENEQVIILMHENPVCFVPILYLSLMM